ncbi:hypothetical protein ELI15_14055 [Rhizobium ruizarguesonis]|uniref:hypothetical protein n=1 Tax=Rhizobium ruizarguesonis TaxID=2081791 RepID=UPI00102F8025|nr:hypothetical protein [Rhizobium ruizarguesonis]TAW65413.1 hypothetical protein ELI15_14055 [Rhizobium ruizarguesonis]
MIEWLRKLAADEFGRIVITIAGTLTAVALGTFLGTFKDVFIENGKRKRLAWLTAVRLTVILDKYVDNCSENVQDTGHYDNEGVRHTRVAQPQLEYPSDLGWTSLHRQLMYAAFRLKVAHDSVESSLEFIGSEISFPPDYDEYYAEKRVSFSEQGLAALELIRSLKDHYDVPTADRRGYDPLGTFNGMLEARDKEDAEREARRQELERKRIAAGEPPGLFPI